MDKWEALKTIVEKRRAYVRRRVKELKESEMAYRKANKRGRTPHEIEYSQALRGGMLSELSTISAFISWIEEGKLNPDELYNIEDDPKD